jgi:hypothetical protein
MDTPLPPIPRRYDGPTSTVGEPVRLPERARDVRRRALAAFRRVVRALARTASALLAAAGAEMALLLSEGPSWVIPKERLRQRGPAPLARAIEPPDLNAIIGELLYPGYPGAVVRFTEAMAGTNLMANYPWSYARGWVARN